MGYGLLVLVFIMALAGAVVKVVGGVFYGSRALFVDALTCFANLVALSSILYYYRVSLEPPDTDHPYGHYRFSYVGVIVSLITYGYVAGIASTELIHSFEYHVDFQAFYYALAGLFLYGLTILFSMRIGGVFRVYGLFTVSELYESIVTIFASLIGALYTYIIDYIGAIGLTIYIFYELVTICRETISVIVDRSPSKDLVREIHELIMSSGYEVIDLRIRCVAPNIYHGDARIKPITSKTLDLELLKKLLREKYNLDMVFEITSSDHGI